MSFSTAFATSIKQLSPSEHKLHTFTAKQFLKRDLPSAQARSETHKFPVCALSLYNTSKSVSPSLSMKNIRTLCDCWRRDACALLRYRAAMESFVLHDDAPRYLQLASSFRVVMVVHHRCSGESSNTVYFFSILTLTAIIWQCYITNMLASVRDYCGRWASFMPRQRIVSLSLGAVVLCAPQFVANGLLEFAHNLPSPSTSTPPPPPPPPPPQCTNARVQLPPCHTVDDPSCLVQCPRSLSNTE